MEKITFDSYAALQKALGYTFKNKKLLLKALTRQSAIEEGLQSPDIGHFQQLEFIGDKVLNLVMSDILQENNLDWNEGQLTQAVAKFVNNKGPLAKIAQTWDLGNLLIMGRGEDLHNGVRANIKVLSDAVEAIIGAIWQDSQHDYLQVKQLIAQYMQVVGLRHANYAEIQQAILSHSLTAFAECYLECYVEESLKEAIIICLIETIHEGQINNGIEFIKLFLKKPLSQKALDGALIDSIGYYQLETAKLLLKQGANPNAVDHEQYSALQLAVKNDYDAEITSHLVELLLAHNADPNYKRGYVIQPKQTYFKSGYVNLRQLLAHKREKKLIEDKDTALHLLIKGATTLKVVLIKMLLNHKANPNYGDNDGKTPLHLICELYLAENELFEFVKNLFEAKANPNIQDNRGNTPLHLLIQTYDHLLFDAEKFIQIIDMFIKAGIDLNKQNHEGNTILHLASCNKVDWPNRLNKECNPISVINRIALIDKLIDSGVDVTIKNKQGLTAYDYEKQIQIPTKTVTLLKEIGYFGDRKLVLSENSTQIKQDDIHPVIEKFKVML